MGSSEFQNVFLDPCENKWKLLALYGEMTKYRHHVYEDIFSGDFSKT
jgi:hypothetical protein